MEARLREKGIENWNWELWDRAALRATPAKPCVVSFSPQVHRCCALSSLVDATLPLPTPVPEQAIAALLSNDPRSLRALRLRHAPRLSDASIRTIAARCTDLELLDLSGCGGLTDRALDAISGAFHGTLQRVLIACCPQISRAGVERMVRYLKPPPPLH